MLAAPPLVCALTGPAPAAIPRSAVPTAFPRARRYLSDSLRQQEDWQARLRARLLEQIRPRNLRAAESEVQRLHEAGVPARGRRGFSPAPPRQAGDGRLSDAHRRDVLVSRRRLRQRRVARRRSRVHGDRARTGGNPPWWNDRDPAMARTYGSSFRNLSRPPVRARWAVISSPRRWCRAPSLAWTRTTDSFRARTPCPVADSETSSHCRSSTVLGRSATPCSSTRS